MKRNLLLIIALILIIFSITSCKAQNQEINHEIIAVDKNEIEQEIIPETLNIIPFKERKFIYQNPLQFSDKQISDNKDNKKVDKYYPQISGLINKEIETKINEQIINYIDERHIEVENTINTIAHNPSIDFISTNVFVDYSCNNVLFLEYSTYISYNVGTFLESYNFTKSQGYDLKTGNILELKDLFRRDVDYNKILNDLIYMELIKSNYDDPDSLFMKGPFQGIRENQSFSFNENRLTIIMDNKNSEFFIAGYPVTISIPLKDIGDDLAIFDRYFDEEINIFENKRIKKLMPNYTYFSIKKAILEYERYYDIRIEIGEFKGIENMESKKLLDNAVANNLDVDGFKERANNYIKENPRYYGGLHHQVNVVFNNGGYISVVVHTGQYDLNMSEENQKYINFDLNNNKIMTVKDLFIEDFDYKAKILELLHTEEYKFLTKNFKNAEIYISENEFYFTHDTVLVSLYQAEQDVDKKRMWIDYKDLGYENISIFQ